MEYTAALIVYFCGIAGVVTCLCGLVISGKNKIVVSFLSVYMLAFCLIVYVGGAMLAVTN